MGFEKAANVVVDGDIPDSPTMHKQSNETSLTPSISGDLKMVEYKALEDLI